MHVHACGYLYKICGHVSLSIVSETSIIEVGQLKALNSG